MFPGGRVLLPALAAAALLAGCGGDDPTIPADRGDQLLTRLDEVEGAVAEGNCEGAQESADLFVSQVDQLPAEVDDEVKRLLVAGGERLQEVAVEQCEEPTPTGPSGEAGFQPEETTTTPETTADPTTETTTSTPEEQQTPPDDDGDDEGGNQGGNTGNQGGGNQGGGSQSGGTGSGGVGGGGD